MVRVIVIGLDGATWDLIKPWADKGELPTFKKLMENGSWGHLESTIPPVTCPAWVSMLTGKNPGKLGIYYFRQPDWDSLTMRFVNIKWDEYNPLWKILNSEGYATTIVNVPTVTPDPTGYLGAYVQCPIMGSENVDQFAYPEYVRHLLKELDYERLVNGNPHTLGWDEYLNEVYTLVNKKIKLASKLFKKGGWELFFFTIFYTDQVMHFFWHYMDKNHPRHIPDDKYKDAILNFFKFIDTSIEEFLYGLREDDILFLVSDHGHGPMHWEINYNVYFNNKGYLKFKNKYRRLFKLNFYKALAKLYRSPMGKLVDKIGILNKLKETKRREIDTSIHAIDFIDWDNTLAYNPAAGTIFINLKGREKYGVVSIDEYHTVRSEIINLLKELKDPRTNVNIVSTIWVKEDVYSGKYFDIMPDILIEPVGETFYGSYGLDSAKPFKLLSDPTPLTYSTHTRRGIFLAYGPGIKKGHKIENAKIYDIAPTILHIFGLPIPNDMDGRVLMEIFEEDSEFAKRRPKYVDPGYREKKQEDENLKKAIRNLKLKGKL
ncbi:alkaline phosphatase family protein [Geoglobus acetivorans]|uniref:Type I phosphodiesterase/nucleotide pyrophosphatase n=1 Tax=Geoglobus acetivorans TaxID=565033 RepID=A0A0A7GDS7_GEOAI|nr:hypothetical protein GACE_1130 [Geoglobus acetivorans]